MIAMRPGPMALFGFVQRLGEFAREAEVAGAIPETRPGDACGPVPADHAAVEMVEAILKDKKKILPCAVYLEGEYGIKGLCVGVPVKLGSKGAEEIIQIKLTAEENAALQKSAASVKELCTVLGI